MMGYADYYLLLSPPEEVKQQISRYKKASINKIGAFESMNSPAHISIVKTERQKAFIVEPAFERMEKRLNTMPPIVLHINGFNYFKHGDKAMSIYADIRQTDSVKKWFRLLFSCINVKHASFTPHITIARNIHVSDFYTLWPHFEKAKYVEPFWIKELLVLKRETFTHEPKWSRYKTISFKNEFAALAEKI
ncbi:hypothetical protein GCM10023149_02740 [Mucilaginibacter gynuensis]|uniref:2'-5' RNA ligase n=1 Tax=Mucilaginibacter gynuensis TaxID=1302236 RepID=A0ABP8FQH8_9SPHI